MNKNLFKKLSQKYNTPLKVQKLIRSFQYNRELGGETLNSAYKSFNRKSAHCLEGAVLAAAILEHQGYQPLVMSLESIDNLDHVIYVYKKNKKWGSIGCSRDAGLFGRRPVYRCLRDLAMSYYEPYIDKTGCITGYQVAHLDDSKSNWRFSSKNIWKLEQHLIEIKHVSFRFNKKRYQALFKRYLKGILPKKKSSWL
ncbi:MAG: hypothetical protein AABY53_02015 [Bdellovibrionota bacterium]